MDEDLKRILDVVEKSPEKFENLNLIFKVDAIDQSV